MEKVWLKKYQAGVAPEINPDKWASLVEIFEMACQKYKNLPAFVNMGRVYTYSELDEKSRHFAAFLQNVLRLKKGDRIALMMPNLLQYPVAMFGALRAGLIVVNVNPLYTPRELSHQLVDSGAKAIVVVENFAHTLAQVINDSAIKHIIMTQIGDCLNFPKSWIVNFVVKRIKKMVGPYHLKKYYQFNQALNLGANAEFRKVLLSGKDIAYLQYTGGTTGLAKSAMLTHRNMIANLEQAAAWLKPVMKEGAEIVITALPLYHIFSLTANCLTFMECGGLNVLITNPRDIKGFIKELKHYAFTAITGVNTLFNALLNNPNFAHLDFSGLKISLGGGMAVQRTVAERWKKVTGKVLIEAYGLTEASPAVCINPLNLQEFNGSVGLPVPSTDISIQDDIGRELSFNQAGELCVRGPQVMKGYWERPGETDLVFKDGWLHTGDIATVDPSGYVRIVDRKKDMIVISGFNVYPTEVEDVIAMLPGVFEVAVVGVMREAGELVKAFIVRRDPSLTKETIFEHCRKQLTAYKVPKEIEFRDVLPKSNVGKILRYPLRQEKDLKYTH